MSSGPAETPARKAFYQKIDKSNLTAREAGAVFSATIFSPVEGRGRSRIGDIVIE